MLPFWCVFCPSISPTANDSTSLNHRCPLFIPSMVRCAIRITRWDDKWQPHQTLANAVTPRSRAFCTEFNICIALQHSEGGTKSLPAYQRQRGWGRERTFSALIMCRLQNEVDTDVAEAHSREGMGGNVRLCACGSSSSRHCLRLKQCMLLWKSFRVGKSAMAGEK